METNQSVGWQFYQDGKWWHGDDRIKDHRKNTEEAGFRVRDLYAAPQAAEQKPELAKYQPCGCVICTCEHETQCQGCGGHHCGTHPVGQFSEPAYLQTTEQQPAPDVSALVDALEQIERWDGFPSTDKTWEGSGEPVSYGAAFGSNGERDFMREVARAAIASYHNQRGKV